jgi:hypothetical protein
MRGFFSSSFFQWLKFSPQIKCYCCCDIKHGDLFFCCQVPRIPVGCKRCSLFSEAYSQRRGLRTTPLAEQVWRRGDLPIASFLTSYINSSHNKLLLKTGRLCRIINFMLQGGPRTFVNCRTGQENDCFHRNWRFVTVFSKWKSLNSGSVPPNLSIILTAVLLYM